MGAVAVKEEVLSRDKKGRDHELNSVDKLVKGG
jgi:hypothetical protein